MSYTISMEILMMVSEILIISLSLWILFKLRGYGGLIGKSLSNIGYGTVILGFSQIIETLPLEFLAIETTTLESIHHLIFLIGLILIAVGFKRLMEGK